MIWETLIVFLVVIIVLVVCINMFSSLRSLNQDLRDMRESVEKINQVMSGLGEREEIPLAVGGRIRINTIAMDESRYKAEMKGQRSGKGYNFRRLRRGNR